MDRYEAEENARLNQRPQIEGGQTGANGDWDNIRRQQDDVRYDGRGGMGVMRSHRGGRNGGAARGRGANRAQTQPFRAHHEAQKYQQLGQTRGRGGTRGFRGLGRGGDRARHGPGEQQQKSAQNSKRNGLKIEAQTDPDTALETACKVYRGIDHLEVDCAQGSSLGFISTWCMPHCAGLYGDIPQECSGVLNHCMNMLLVHERLSPAVVVARVFKWITNNRSSRPEPRCVGADWHWATCIADYMERHPEVEVTANMLPVRRHEIKEREKNQRGDPSRTWTSFDFKNLARSKFVFQDPYWNTRGDHTELMKKLKEYAASEPDRQFLLPKMEETETSPVVKLESSPEPCARVTNAFIK